MNSSFHFALRYQARLAQFQRPMRPILIPFAAFLLFASMFSTASAQTPNTPAQSLELSRPVCTWEFLPIVGTRAALFGDEAGRMEAWVYPLKLLREFHLQFHESGRVVPAEALARTVVVRPGIQHHRGIALTPLPSLKHSSCRKGTRRDRFARRGNRAAARDGGELCARPSVGVARRHRWDLYVLGPGRSGLCTWRGNEEVCCAWWVRPRRPKSGRNIRPTTSSRK